MGSEDVLLLVVTVLAAVFFLLGLMEIFGASLRPDRRRRELARRRRKPIDSQPMPAPAVTARAPELSRPAQPPAGCSQAIAASSDEEAAAEADQGSDADPFPLDQSERGKLVLHYADGRVVKGYSYDFYPNKPRFHLLPPVAGFSFTDEAIEVRIKDLKAVFFVRGFLGDPSHCERGYFAEGEQHPGRKVEVTFADGEVLVGTTVGYNRGRPGFFFIPADPKSNNVKVFAVSAAVTRVRFL